MFKTFPGTAVLSCAIIAAAAGSAHAQLLGDPNFDALAVGTPPDNATPAGAWQFPANYVTGLAGEFDPSNYTIVDTSSFDPSGGGLSLMNNINDAANNMHLTNLLTSVINEAPGQIVHIKFRVWVAEAGVGGGAMYFGADMGGGGFTNTTDRGPQIIWLANGTFCYANGTGVNTPLVPAYPAGEWQQVVLHIHLDTDKYDVDWGSTSIPMSTVGTGLPFRSAPINKIDRISFAHFGLTNAVDHAFYDDFGISVQSPPCYADCNGDGALNLSDFGCFQTKFALGDPYADCNGDGVRNLSDFGCFQTKFALGCP